MCSNGDRQRDMDYCERCLNENRCDKELIDVDSAECFFENVEPESAPNESMDGDFDTGMASAGFGTDEDYNAGFGTDEDLT